MIGLFVVTFTVTLIIRCVNTESLEISSYSRVAKSGSSNGSSGDGPQIHRAREGVMNSNLWFPHVFNQTTTSTTTTETTTSSPTPAPLDSSKEFSGRSADESRQFPSYQLSNPVFNGRQHAISAPASSSGYRQTVSNHRYDEKPIRYPAGYISYTPPPSMALNQQQRQQQQQQQQSGKPLGKNVAMDRYTPGISYYASIKAAQHSADFQKAQNSQSSGDLVKSPSQTVNYIQSPSPQSQPQVASQSQSQPMKYVPSKNLYSFPPNSDATYIPSSPGDLFQNPINSYSPPPAGPADNTPYSNFAAPPIPPFMPTVIPTTSQPQMFITPMQSSKNPIYPNMDTITPLIRPRPPQPKDLQAAASQMQSSEAMPPPANSDAMQTGNSDTMSPAAMADAMPSDAMPSASPMPTAEMPTSDHIPASGPSSHELLGIHDTPPSGHDHHPQYLDYPHEHDHGHFNGFSSDGDHDYGTHGIDTYPEVVLDHDPHQDYFDHHFHHHPPPPPPPPPTMPPTTMPPPPPEETGRVKKYSYFYLGRRLWYIPLYFTVWFTFYVAWLIIQSIGRHKVDLPNHTVSRRSIYTGQSHKETVRKVDKSTVFVMSQIDEFVDKYL